MDLRGAKSNVMSLFGTYRNRNCPLVALVAAWPHFHAGANDALILAGYPLRTVGGNSSWLGNKSKKTAAILNAPPLGFYAQQQNEG